MGGGGDLQSIRGQQVRPLSVVDPTGRAHFHADTKRVYRRDDTPRDGRGSGEGGGSLAGGIQTIRR